MKQSEKMLLGLTVLMIFVFFGYRMEWHHNLMGLVERFYIADSVLQSERDKVERVASVVAREAETRARYAATVRQQLQVPSPDKDPKAEFSEYVVALCQQLGVSLRSITPPGEEPIPDADDYKYITLKVSYQQSWPQVAQLLKNLDKNYLLIKEMTLNAPLDRQMDVNLSLARVTPLTEEEKQARLAARTRQTP